MSEIRVNSIVSETGTGNVAFNKGINVTGVVTGTSFAGDGSGLTNLVGTGVTNNVNTVNLNVISGISTFGGGLQVGAAGVGGTVSALGHVEFVGVTTIGLGLTLTDNIQARFGNAGDLRIYHNGTHNYIQGSTASDLIISNNGNFIVQTDDDEFCLRGIKNAYVDLYYNGSKKFETLNTGVKVTGITSTTSFSVGPGLIQEKSAVPAAALTGTVNFDIIDDGMVHWHYTNASASWVVNLRGDASTTFNSTMDIGKTAVFTLYSASNNTSYYMTDFQIDGVSMTERWNGGSAPSAATGSGTDVYTFNIFKTGDAAYTVYANFSNFA